MRHLSLLILTLGFAAGLLAQSPHGASLKIDCAACHSPEGWEIQKDFWRFSEPVKPKISKTTGQPVTTDTLRFNHNSTQFALKGAHVSVNCKDCHQSLVFEQASSDCISCHTDIHQQTVGNDCARCHTPNNWIVDNVTELHQDNGFPLTGVHLAVSCDQCHTSETTLRFDRLGNDCRSCHLEDFKNTTNPNHTEAGFSQDCLECHDLHTPGWHTNKVNHDFFPLTKGHEIQDCARCHTGGDFANTPNNCAACHQPDFEGALNPNHVSAGFSNDCAACHTTDPDWMPAQFTQHDADYFPIYSGKHQGVWSQCAECHTNSSNYAEYSCTICHLNPETDDEHEDVTGYVYENTACLACHPTGDAENSFDHNESDFPLTGAHLTTECAACHSAGYQGTPTACAACHTEDYNQSANPSHTNLGLSMDCAGCHTTDPGWAPATFAVHNDYYALNGAHAAIANECATCHNGDYNNTPNTCAGCHTEDFNQTTDPNHQANQFPTDCATCHTETAWTPSTFDHNTYYPFTGAHVPIADDCVACHHGDYANTPNTCAGCHTENYNQSTNPNHIALNLPTNCEMCHTTTPDWAPATFAIHNDYYVLNGAHAAIANDCAACHNGNYNNTPNTCIGCHSTDYAETTDPDHEALQFSTDCASCHSENAWLPATFDHDGQYFPIYSGEHQGEWNACADCHTNLSDYSQFTCTTCHTNPETNNEHNGVNGYTYNSPACLACHPTGDADFIFDHNTTDFPLTGAHLTTECAACHTNGYVGTPTDCALCHADNFNQATNPNHSTLGLSTDCASCHTTAPGWAPATFANHNNYYALNGAHAAIANDCAACHNGDYNNTPNTCIGCHTVDFNQTTDPNHQANQFPTDCASCHSETAWAPSTFDHNDHFPFTGAHIPIADNCIACHQGGNYTSTPNTCAGCHTNDYNQSTNPNHTSLNLPTNCEMCHTTAPDWAPATFAIHDDFYVLNGAHAVIANDCAACHNGNYNNTPNTCIGCHSTDFNQTTNPNHVAAQFPTDCTVCHSETAWAPAVFDHDAQYFPIYSGKHEGEWNACADCHTNPSNYAEFTCTSCHTNPETDDEHEDVGGYTYNSTACLACHPTGDGDLIFDHNSTGFQLTGAHLSTECLDCHTTGFQGTPTACASCHTQDYNQSLNPNHGSLGLSTDCASCHTTDPGWAPATFAAHDSYFALTGAHHTIAGDCAACHNGDYNNTPNTCSGCHTTDYEQTANPNHAALGFSTDCASCHTTAPDWAPATFANHNEYYALNGAHTAIANDCAACHNGNYNDTPNTCFACHSADYNATTNPNHAEAHFNNDCLACHSEDAWSPSTLDHDAQYFPIYSGAHNGEWDACIDCHTNPGNFAEFSCTACHVNPETDQEHNGVNGYTYNNSACLACHPTGSSDDAFDHNNTDFPLTGAHLTADCLDCHAGGFSGTSTECASCHTPDYNASLNPNHQVLGLSTNCASCHTTEPGWAPATFAVHDDYYILNGAHAAVANDCAGCHNGDYNNTPNTCAGCHTPDYAASTNPNHQALGLPTNCETCHTTNPGWSPATFPIHDDFYVISGAHTAIANDCAACHSGDYANTPNTCAGCHTPDYNATTNPDHEAAQFPTDCESCHTQNAWSPSTFNHNSFYPITGAHTAIANDCNACHQGNYTNTPNTCAGCHTPDYNATTNPDHEAAQFPTDCESCHTQNAWSPSTFNHNSFYPITGAHTAIANDCNACHQGNYTNTPNTCAGCHTPDYNATTDPDHEAAQFPTDCESCHTQNAWSPSTFNHSAFYPITGAHTAIANDCNACHQGNYTNTPNTCAGCHTPDYNASTNPNHQALGLPTNCEMCHTTDPGWDPATFPIHNDYYVISGAHTAIANDCAACHQGNYTNTPNTCAGCHTPDYNATTNPDHEAALFPTDCESCHTQNAWSPSTFNHSAFYPITGAHTAIANDCNACHQGNYTNTPNTCAGCHTPDYNATTNPDHEAALFPTDCESCHSQTAWSPSTFNHSAFYPFTGAHIPIANDCNACHQGNYTNTPNTCAGCHTPDYAASTNPNHQALGLPTNCEMCHTTDPGWDPATFPIHNDYYVLAGAHATISNDCAACHQGNYTNTPNTCAGCHLSDYNTTTNPDHEVAQFPTDCESCHSQAAWSPSTFNHSAFYPFTGGHIPISNDCNACHQGNYTNTPNTCAGCHTPDYNTSTNPNHQALALPTNCEMCHTTDPNWDPATFPIHNSFWALVGAHASIANDCAACHNGNYNNTPSTCVGCHLADYNATNDPNHATAGFPTDCIACHSQTAWTPATFNHDGMYFPIYSGKHDGEWNQCSDCHTTPGNYALFSCIDCHEHDNPAELADDHEDVSGYQYSSPACYNCHPDGSD